MIRPQSASLFRVPSGTTITQPIDLRGLHLSTVYLDGVTLSHDGPAFLTDEFTHGCNIRGGTVVGCAESRLFGGDRRTQTGGANTIHSVRFKRSSLMVGGVGHELHHCEFVDTPRHAIRFGLLEWDKQNTFGVNRCKVVGVRFTHCFTEGDDEDYGVLIAMRDLTQDIEIVQPQFIDCGARALYLDDGMSNVTVRRAQWSHCNRDFWIGGGRRIHIDGFTTGAKRPSRWDNRFSPDSPMPKSFRDHFLDPNKEFALQHRWITGAPAWLERFPFYIQDWERREQWTSSGQLILRIRSGPSPELLGGPSVECRVQNEPGIHRA